MLPPSRRGASDDEAAAEPLVGLALAKQLLVLAGDRPVEVGASRAQIEAVGRRVLAVARRSISPARIGRSRRVVRFITVLRGRTSAAGCALAVAR